MDMPGDPANAASNYIGTFKLKLRLYSQCVLVKEIFVCISVGQLVKQGAD